jgi:hypothetical protein
MLKRIEVVTNVAIVVTCVLASAVLLKKLDLFPHRGGPAARLGVGTVLPTAWHVETANAAPVVVAVIRSTCHFCTDSMPFYRQLAATTSRGRRIHLVAVSDEPPEVTKGYLSAHGVDAAQIVSAPRDTLLVSGTPTLFGLDRKGVVRVREVGRLSDERRQQFFNAVTRLD